MYYRSKPMSKEEFQEKVVNRNKAINEARRKEADIKCYVRESYQRGQANKSNYMSHNAALYRLGN